MDAMDTATAGMDAMDTARMDAMDTARAGRT